MAFIRNDPKQSKTVIGLLVILLIVVGVTIVRVRQVISLVQPFLRAPVAAQAPRLNRGYVASYSQMRNPFEKPPFIGVSSIISGRIANLPEHIMGTGEIANLPEHSSAGASPSPNTTIPPIDIRSLTLQDGKTAAVPPITDKNQTSIISLSLLATIKGTDGTSAIIKINGSETQVVEVGDRLKGGFKVKTLDDTRAILTDGRNIIIAKRPQP
ncbi:MAG: hypothetical protein NT018_09760 [Armatimonadetes bacterium]|nr:hypothetical protein [Armatimonadota bacterium]